MMVAVEERCVFEVVVAEVIDAAMNCKFASFGSLSSSRVHSNALRLSSSFSSSSASCSSSKPFDPLPNPLNWRAFDYSSSKESAAPCEYYLITMQSLPVTHHSFSRVKKY
eukprot:514392_1